MGFSFPGFAFLWKFCPAEVRGPLSLRYFMKREKQMIERPACEFMKSAGRIFQTQAAPHGEPDIIMSDAEPRDAFNPEVSRLQCNKRHLEKTSRFSHAHRDGS
jgi:hypothetical protein